MEFGISSKTACSSSSINQGSSGYYHLLFNPNKRKFTATAIPTAQKSSKEELLVVVGGGAAGVYGAIRAKTLPPNLDVLVIEKGKPLSEAVSKRIPFLKETTFKPLTSIAIEQRMLPPHSLAILAAAKGNIDPFENYQTCLNQLMTPNQNTILHVYLENQSKQLESTDFVVQVLEMCPPLLLQVNIKGENPLHFAARYGHANVVKVLINRAKALPIDPESKVTEEKKMLRMKNVKKDTALHVASRFIQSRVVKILTEEDPEFSYSANVHGETPLYIAANIEYYFSEERNNDRAKVIEEILRNCISVDYGGPNGRTALHAAVMVEDYETARKILEKEKNLIRTTDQNGWSPLHYSAYFSSFYLPKVLLEYDASAAYIVDADKNRTALHIAALGGNVEAMKEIVSSSEIPEIDRLKTEKDDKGNTPFHLVAALAFRQVDWGEFVYESKMDKEMICGRNKQNLSIKNILQGTNPEMQREILESIEDVGSGPFGRIVVGEVKWASSEDKKKLNEIFDKMREAHLVVAALIATVTFAAAFTLPGGYKNEEGPNQGTAILTKKAAFIAFVISDAIAMVLSLSAVFTHFCSAAINRAQAVAEIQTLLLLGLATAAAEGNIDPFENYQTCLNQLMTPNLNLILHVYFENQSEEPEFTDFVDQVLETCPALLLQVNLEGETPLHFAARYGHAKVVKVLIDRAKALPIDPESGLTEAQKMMRMKNVEKDTALHVVARNSRSNVVKILTKEDPEFSYSANDHGETPLYIAASVGYRMVIEHPTASKLLQHLLDIHSSP
ncbi:unnamed protein product [Dovyalis caffra]|uniref:PGG domain-containing protein n=1 Tax=Dovyalis caffra TaxID=77055 RepID=A0AAV1SF75_9ROSI|nr:unnamed protein product [Dovyalis caffra]